MVKPCLAVRIGRYVKARIVMVAQMDTVVAKGDGMEQPAVQAAVAGIVGFVEVVDLEEDSRDKAVGIDNLEQEHRRRSAVCQAVGMETAVVESADMEGTASGVDTDQQMDHFRYSSLLLH